MINSLDWNKVRSDFVSAEPFVVNRDPEPLYVKLGTSLGLITAPPMVILPYGRTVSVSKIYP
jgi:hypothetical protein